MKQAGVVTIAEDNRTRQIDVSMHLEDEEPVGPKALDGLVDAAHREHGWDDAFGFDGVRALDQTVVVRCQDCHPVQLTKGTVRSEERRVGKESRCRREADQEKKKIERVRRAYGKIGEEMVIEEIV